ncbi:hypothetical protein IPdc08_00831 [archaeon]|nr:hypothetical protein IPdc08_00831 [archaeon]
MGRILSRKREPVKLDNVMECEKEFLKHEGNILFTEEFENLSGKERLVLKSLVSGKRTSSNIAKDLKEKVSNVGQFIYYLVNKDIIQKKKRGRYYIVDPVYEEWLVRRLGGKSFGQDVLETMEKPKTLQEIYALFP